MTQLEILNLAQIGLSALIEKEKEINRVSKLTLLRENNIAIARLKKYEKEFCEIGQMIFEEENRGL